MLATLVTILNCFNLFFLDQLIHDWLIIDYQLFLLSLSFLWHIFSYFAKIKVKLLFYFYFCLFDVVDVYEVYLFFFSWLELHHLLLFHLLDHFKLLLLLLVDLPINLS